MTTVQKNENDISAKAMKVRLSLSYWVPAITDKKVGDELSLTKKADKNVARVRKQLFSNRDFLPITKAINKIRRIHESRTLPWSDDGARVLAAVGYFDYQIKMNEAIAGLNEAVQTTLLDKYDTLMHSQAYRQGDMFDANDYPKDVDAVRSKYSVRLKFDNLSTGADFRADLGDEAALAAIKANMADDFTESMKAAMKDIWERLQLVVQRAATRLKSDSFGTKSAEALIETINDLLDLIPSLNVAGDEDLNDFAATVRAKIGAFSGSALADDEALRAAVAAEADDILAKMAAYMA
jgi:hypothetical protein